MDLEQLRAQIDAVDNELIRLFAQRMDISAEIAKCKRANGLPVLDVRREEAKLRAVSEKSRPELADHTACLFSLLMELSRCHQNRELGNHSALSEQIRAAIDNTPPLFPEKATVACQGVEGADAQLACRRLFRTPNEFFFSTYDAVFTAIEKGFCRYGVLPLENSTAGSVNAVYDLMTRHNFRIVRSVRVMVDYNVLARPGVKLEDIKEIYAPEQAADQCVQFFARHKGIKFTACEDAAGAAKLAAESGRNDAAALAGRNCADLYGLKCLAPSVQDRGNNFTRYICISREGEIYPGADRTSLMMVLAHRPGSLYRVLSRFNALGINLIKLESRPMPERNFEFMFYFDLESSVYSPQFIQLMGELGELCEEFTYLGSYSEVI